MFGDVGKIGGYKENPSPIFSGFWGHIRHRDGHPRCLCCGTALQLRSWGRAYPPQWYHSLGAPSTDQTKPVEANNSNDRSVKCLDFSKNKCKLNHISLSLCLLNLHPKSSTENFPWKSNLMRNYPRLMHCHGALDRTTTFQCIRRQRFFALRHLGGTFITMKTGSFHIPAIQALRGLKPQLLSNCHEFLTKSWGG